MDIKKQRRKYIRNSMLAIIGVLTFIIVLINIFNVVSIKKYADEILDVLVENNGNFDDKKKPEEGENIQDPIMFRQRITTETPFETRFFSVDFDNNIVKGVNLTQVASIDKQKAIDLALQALDNGKEKGSINKYRYRVITNNEMSSVIFVDCSRLLDNSNVVMIWSIISSMVGLLGAAIVALIFSKRVLQPIIENNEKQKVFITNAAHELKTPLTIISANNEIIEMEHGKSDSNEAIEKQVKRMNNMVKNLTTLARMNELSTDEEKIKFSISDALEDSLDSFKNTFERNELIIKANIQPDIIYEGIEKQIRDAFVIILSNCDKYALKNIEVKLEKVGRKIEITFTNDVESIENGNLDKYFERFYRSNEARAKNEGNGIGLSILKEIINHHKGNITAIGENNNFILKITL